MDALKSSSSAMEMCVVSTQPNIEEEKTDSETPANVSPSITTSAPEVEETPGCSDETKTLSSIRDMKSTSEIRVDVLPTGEETVHNERIALDTSMKLNDKSKDSEKGFSKDVHVNGNPALETDIDNGLTIKLVRDLSQTTSLGSTSTVPSGNTQTTPSFATHSLALPNSPQRSIDGVSSTSLLSPECVTVYEKTPREMEPREPSQVAIEIKVDTVKAVPGSSTVLQAPILTFTESSPEMEAHITHVMHKPTSSIEEALRIASSVGSCAVPVIDVLPPPEHRPLGSRATRRESVKDAGLLEVPPRRSRARKNPEGEEVAGQDGNEDTGSLDTLGPPCDDTLGKYLVSPCPYMMQHQRLCVWLCVLVIIFTFIAGIIAAVLYDRWLRGL